VLDGGLPKWVKQGRATQSGEPAAPPAATFRPDYRAARLRGVGDVLRNTESRAELVLDARAAGRFTGATPEPRAGMRSGHIPGSANVPYTELLNADGTFLPVEAVRARFAQAGVDANSRPVTSCGSGVTACILTLGLRLAGLPEGAAVWAFRTQDSPGTADAARAVFEAFVKVVSVTSVEGSGPPGARSAKKDLAT
jgi:thiosulfate/3-mercaptopyruvate sulfurtransferase